MRRLVALFVVSAFISYADPTLEKRVAELEQDVADLKAALAPMLEKEKMEQVIAQQRTEARARMRKDSELYSQDERAEIESLYQVANRQWRTEEGKESLKKLIGTYDKANRTGCALLYLGQMSTGEDRVGYLQKAIADFSDCYYGNGVQVGAYARFYLAHHYKESGEEGKAMELFEEIREKYPHAIDHKGNLLSALIKD